MKFVLTISSVVLAVIVVAVSGRSALLPESPDIKSSADNVIILEAAVSGEPRRGQKAHIEGDKLLLEGRNFSSVKDMIDILGEEKKVKSFDLGETTLEPFSIKVPISRNFSSLKELFEILSEDGDTRPNKSLEDASLSYVKGTEVNSSEYTIFFTP